MNTHLIGVAIATFNAREHLRECLKSLAIYGQIYLHHIVVVDDNSQDGTCEMLEQEFPDVECISGNGNLWWTGGTNIAIQACLHKGCQSVLLLNPDCVLESQTLPCLLRAAQLMPNAILASTVVRYDIPDEIWWAGSTWGPLVQGLPIYTSRYMFHAGSSYKKIGKKPYVTSEAHGRAVLVPISVFEAIGLYDAQRLPHYGADVEFCLRANENGIRIFIVPEARVRLHVDHTGMKAAHTWRAASAGYWARLWKRKNGETVRVWWCILSRHLPLYEAIPTYIFILLLNTIRYWQSVLKVGAKV